MVIHLGRQIIKSWLSSGLSKPHAIVWACERNVNLILTLIFSQPSTLEQCTTYSTVSCGPGASSLFSQPLDIAVPFQSLLHTIPGNHSNWTWQSCSFLCKPSQTPDSFRINLSCFAKPHTSSSSFCELLYTLYICGSLDMHCFLLLSCFCTCRYPSWEDLLQGSPLHSSSQLMPS